MGVLCIALFLTVVTITLAQPQYNPQYVSLSAEPPAPVTYSDEVEELAARKRAYQAAYASLASQMAAQSDLLSPPVVPARKTPLVLGPTQYLQHRRVTAHQPQPILLAVAPVSPPRVRVPHQRLPVPLEETYDVPQQILQRPQQSQKEEPTLLPNGFLADTEEVAAAKEEHLALMAKAREAAARQEAREAQTKRATNYPAPELEYVPREQGRYYTALQVIRQY